MSEILTVPRVRLAGIVARRRYPFEMDGFYESGMDLATGSARG
jgi:hypothetical protein